MFKFKYLIASAIAAGASVNASAITVYANDFDTATTVASGVSASVSGDSYTNIASPVGGFSGNYLSNMTKGNPAGLTEFSFTNLPAHSAISIKFLIAFIDSWDSSGPGQYGGDLINLFVDGVSIGTLSVCNYNASSCLEVMGGTQVAKGHYFTNPLWIDQVVDMSTSSALNFAHTGSTLTFGLQAFGSGWQGGTDESWGIDNLKIEAIPAAVPEPASWVMMIGGFALAGASLRRRATKIAIA